MDVVESVDGGRDTAHLAPALRLALLRAGAGHWAWRGCAGGRGGAATSHSPGVILRMRGARGRVEDDEAAGALELGEGEDEGSVASRAGSTAPGGRVGGFGPDHCSGGHLGIS